jgi:hypothetical protein
MNKIDSNEETSPSERSLLLPPKRPTGPSRQLSIIPQVHSLRFAILLIFLAIFVLMFVSYLIGTPQLRLYEDIICRHYYDEIKGESHIALTEDIDESLCKIDEIQKELAIVVRGSGVVDSIPSLLFSLSYGMLEDRIGQKSVFGLALTRIILSQCWIILVCWFWRTFPLCLI